MTISPLSHEEVRRTLKEGVLHCKTTAELKPLDRIIGQERAVRALQFGLDIPRQGYNIYVAGRPGTGRTTAVQGYLEDLAKSQPVPPDYVYVHNFDDPYKPNAIQLSPGRGKELVEALDNLIGEAKQIIPKVIESDEFNQRRDVVIKDFDLKRRKILEEVTKKAEKLGFSLQINQTGIALIPIVNGKPLSTEEFAELGEDEKKRVNDVRTEIAEDVRGIQRKIQEQERIAREEIEKLGKSTAIDSIDFMFTELQEKFKKVDEVKKHLDAIKKDIGENLQVFLSRGKQPSQGPIPAELQLERSLRKYKANLIVDNSNQKGAPVIVEENPTNKNLFGFLEREAVFGALFTDFTMIHGGAIHNSNGGYLVLPVEEVLTNPFVYDGLKRAIRNQKIQIEDIGERLGYMTTKTLGPESVPLNVKFVLIGDPIIYQKLYALDSDFKELFKVKADFDTTMKWNDENLQLYASFVCSVCTKENLLHLDSSALSRLIEHSARLAARQTKLSTRFGDIADVLREGNYYAKKEASKIISAKPIKKAIDERYYRSNLIQSKILEHIDNGTIKIDVKGSAVGQVNGLSVISFGDIMFGQPSRVSASVALGKEGIVDINREAELSGNIHTKGVLILNGFLADNFAHDYPLTLSGRLVFEQSYGMVDGDSASSTELYALLSRLSDVPIKQDFAVTGSVNQKGVVQAIGGVNEKIEGYFAVCEAKGLTKKQGVLIPESNVKDLMLKDSVVDAVRTGEFHIYPIKTIAEGIEVLTGVPGGERDSKGNYPENSIFGKVDKKLRYMAIQIKQFGDAKEK